MKMTLADISPTAARVRWQQREVVRNVCGQWEFSSEAERRRAANRQRVADHFDRLNAQGIALPGPRKQPSVADKVSHIIACAFP